MYLSPGLEAFLAYHSHEWPVPVKEFAGVLTALGYEVRQRGDKLVVTKWGSDESLTAWSVMLFAWDDKVRLRSKAKVEGQTITFATELVGGDVPKFVQREIIPHFAIGEFTPEVPEMIVKMLANHWSEVDDGMQADPDIVTISAFASEVAPLAQWFAVTNSDYHNIKSEIVRQNLEGRGIKLLPYKIPEFGNMYSIGLGSGA